MQRVAGPDVKKLIILDPPLQYVLVEIDGESEDFNLVLLHFGDELRRQFKCGFRDNHSTSPKS
jgi:hypothetical protein